MSRVPPSHSVHIETYNPDWTLRAAEEGARLIDALGDVVLKIEHFGSTAVPGLAAKPVLDLMPVVTSLAALEAKRARVEALGYVWHGEFELPDRRFCTLARDGIRLAHLHCYPQGSPHIARHLIFRDYLRAHPAVARAYEQEKRRAAAAHPQDSLAYNREKAAWVTAEEAKALVWAADTEARALKPCPKRNRPAP